MPDLRREKQGRLPYILLQVPYFYTQTIAVSYNWSKKVYIWYPFFLFETFSFRLNGGFWWYLAQIV